MPTPESWREKAKEILDKESDKSSNRPRREFGRTVCNCECHTYCHTCGNPFAGDYIHINCADTLWGSDLGWFSLDTNANQS